MTIEVGADNFEEEVLKSDKPVLVDFWAPWCGPCRTMAPIVESLSKDRADTMKVVKLNVDEHKSISDQYGVKGIPAFLMFKEGKVVDSLIGAKKKQDFFDWADKAAAVPAENGKTAAETKVDIAAREKAAEEAMEEKLTKLLAKPLGIGAAGFAAVNHALTIAGGVLVAAMVPGVLPLALGGIAVAAGLYRMGETFMKAFDVMKNPEEAVKKQKADMAARAKWSPAKKLLAAAGKMALGVGVLGAGIYLFGIATAAAGVAATVGGVLLGAKMVLGGTGSIAVHGASMGITTLSAMLKDDKKKPSAEPAPKPEGSAPIVVEPPLAAPAAVVTKEAQKSFDGASRPKEEAVDTPIPPKTPEIKPPAPPQA